MGTARSIYMDLAVTFNVVCNINTGRDPYGEDYIYESRVRHPSATPIEKEAKSKVLLKKRNNS